MAKELNPRQQRFVSEYLKSGRAGPSYTLAGYRNSTSEARDVNACRLLSHAKVKAEIGRRTRAMLKRSDITLEKLLSDAEDARALAMATNQPSAAKGASEFQAKLVGLLVERKESGAPGEFSGLTTPDAVIAAIRQEMGEDAANALLALVGRLTKSEPDQQVTPTTEGSGAIN